MARRAIFRVTTPLGSHVVLSRNRWREIIHFKHPALADHEQDVRHCLEDPDCIRASDKDAETHLYYRRIADRFLCIVVGRSEDAVRFV